MRWRHERLPWVRTMETLRALLLLTTAGVRSHLAMALAAPFGSRERATAHWTLGIAHSVNFLFCVAAEWPACHFWVSWGPSGSLGDDVVGESLELQADLVIPTWLAPEVTAKLPLEVGETLEDLLSIKRCLKPRSEWPATPPRAKVHSSPQEWLEATRGWHGDHSPALHHQPDPD